MEKDKIPTKAEKLQLEKEGRVISGFDVNKDWDSRVLHEELSKLLTCLDNIEGMLFEIVKNSGGTLIRPKIPAGKEIDAKLLLKSIAPSGCIYISDSWKKCHPAQLIQMIVCWKFHHFMNMTLHQ